MENAISRTQQALLIVMGLPIGFLAGYAAYRVVPALAHAVVPELLRVLSGS